MALRREGRLPHLTRPTGLAGEVGLLRRETADALTVLETTRPTLIFSPSGTQDESRGVYSSWVDLCAAIALLPFGACPRIVFTSSFVVPTAGMPASGWYMAMGSWETVHGAAGFSSFFGDTKVTIANGAKIDSLAKIGDGLSFLAAPTVELDTLNWDTYRLSAPPLLCGSLTIGEGACVRNGGTQPLMRTPGLGFQQYLHIWASQTRMYFSASTAPLVNVRGIDRVELSIPSAGAFGTFGNNWLTGVGQVNVSLGVDGTKPTNAGFSGSEGLPRNSKVNPLSATACIRTLTYTSEQGTYPDEGHPDTFTDWHQLYAVFYRLRGPRQIALQVGLDYQGETYLPIPLPPLPAPLPGFSFYEVERIVRAPRSEEGAPCELRLGTGAVLYNLQEVGDGVSIVSAGTAVVHNSAVGLPPSQVEFPSTEHQLTLGVGASLKVASGALEPCLLWTGNFDSYGGGALRIVMKQGSSLESASGVPALALGATGLVTLEMGPGATLGPSAVSGSGTALLYLEDQGGAVINFSQPGWTAPQSLGSKEALLPTGVRRVPIKTNAVVSGTYVCTSGSEFVRVAPDGSLTPVVVTLPNAALFPRETLMVKKINAEVATTVTVGSGGGLIDGAATDVWPATAYLARSYTSDGVGWWKA